ncbi:hypothetical protein ACLKA6_012863 [Drosophila palustris]
MEEEFIQILKRFGQNPDSHMHENDFGFGDDDPAYDMSDPDVTFDNLSCSSSSSSSSNGSWLSASEEEVIGDLTSMEQQQDPIPETPVAVPSSSAINLKNKLLANNNNNKNSNAAATNVAPGNNNMNNNNNNNNNSQPDQQSTPSDLESFFSEQRRIMEDQQQQRKQQQKWNLIKSTKIPTLFLPKVAQIQPLLDRLDKLEGVKNGYNTKCIQNGAIRLHCNSMEIYNKISAELHNDNTELHTHQLRRERGYRVVIRHLHSTTDRQWIHDQLTAQGYTPRFIRVMQHRYTGKPMNLFEEEQAKLAINKARAEMANVFQNGFSFSRIMPATPATRRGRRHQQQQQQQQKQPLTPNPKPPQQQQQQRHQQKQQQQYSAKKQQQKPQQKPQQQQQQQQKPHQPMQKKQEHQQKQQQKQKKQQFMPNKGNNNNNSYNNNSQQTYSQVARAGNAIKPQRQSSSSGPASRHLSAYQAKLRAEQAQNTTNKKQQQQQLQNNIEILEQEQEQQLGQQQQQQQQPDDCLSLAIQQNTHTIAMMGEKMDSMLEIIRVMLSRLIPDSPQQSQQQQRPIHIEPIVRIASPNPNDMSVDTIVENYTQKSANDNKNE